MVTIFRGISNQRGYTLIELIFTITILLIVAIPLSSAFVSALNNDHDSSELDQAMMVAQKVLEDRMSDGDIVVEESEDVALNLPVTQAAPYENYRVQTIVTPITQDIQVEKDLLGNDKSEPSTPVEVIVGNTGKRAIYKLPLDTGVDLSQVDTSVKPIGSVVEDYNYNSESLNLRSDTQPEGLDLIVHLEATNIRLSSETAGNSGNDLSFYFEPDTATQYQLVMRYGDAPMEREVTKHLSLSGLAEANKKMRVAFVIDNENTPRKIKLINKPTFPTEFYIIRGVKDQDLDTYYTGLGTGVNTGKPLLSLTYGTPNGTGGYSDNDPKVASDLIQVRYNFKDKNEGLVRTSRLYELRVRVFRTTDNVATATPVVELRTCRRAIL